MVILCLEVAVSRNAWPANMGFAAFLSGDSLHPSDLQPFQFH